VCGLLEALVEDAVLESTVGEPELKPLRNGRSSWRVSASARVVRLGVERAMARTTKKTVGKGTNGARLKATTRQTKAREAYLKHVPAEGRATEAEMAAFRREWQQA